MDRIIQLVVATAFAIVGYLVHGATGAMAGAVGGFVVASAGVNALRDAMSEGSVIVSGAERREMVEAMHVTQVMLWGMRPFIVADHGMLEKLAELVFGQMVDGVSEGVTGRTGAMYSHVKAVALADVKPEASFAQLRKRYNGRRGGADGERLAGALLTYHGALAPTIEGYEWFIAWCRELRIDHASAHDLWVGRFGEEGHTIADWQRMRNAAVLDDYEQRGLSLFDDERPA